MIRDGATADPLPVDAPTLHKQERHDQIFELAGILSDVVYNQILFSIPMEQSAERYRQSVIREPDLIVFLQTPPQTAAKRLDLRTHTQRLQWENLPHLERIYRGFQDVFHRNPIGLRGELVAVDICALYSKLDAFLLSTIREVVGHIFRATGIRPIIFKGSEILREYAPVGSSADLDLVVLQPHFRRACDALRDQDCVQGRYQKDRGFVPYAPEVIRRVEEGHYETLPFSKAFELALSGAERDRIAGFRDGTFFKVAEIGQ
jgi:hypothetical protein